LFELSFIFDLHYKLKFMVLELKCSIKIDVQNKVA